MAELDDDDIAALKRLINWAKQSSVTGAPFSNTPEGGFVIRIPPPPPLPPSLSQMSMVYNATGSDMPAQSVLGVQQRGMAKYPSDSSATFFLPPVLRGVVPSLGQDFGAFVVTAAAIKNGAIGPCHYAGICAVKIDKSAGTGGYVDVTDGDTTQLSYHTLGSAEVLWQEGGEVPFWAIVRLGNVRWNLLFPVKVEHSSGTGSVTSPYTYDVYDCITSTQLNTPGTPMASACSRPDAKCSPGTYGMAYYPQNDGRIPVLHWVDEQAQFPSRIVTGGSITVSSGTPTLHLTFYNTSDGSTSST